MKSVPQKLASLVLLATVALGWSAYAQPPFAVPVRPPAISRDTTALPAQAVQDKALLLLNAIQAGRYADFTAAITDDFKAALPPESFQKISEPLAPRLQKGYDLAFLGEVHKHDYTTTVWKIVFRIESDDVMMTVTTRDEKEAKVAGLYLD
jgi:hypothetical protein